ncbi:uncharacterized protein LOC6640608 isoform X1 [Drosophila willistoni]|uniref:uncharacterized protein LOC6640608 isoform X1 n=1 Tax=Drosophila willistoni TaxID=7260 RepID=UPI001F071602|nr:uncharacterized protein LOC6640608 isoform X1 [Drosophila willistoni]
MRLNFKCLTLIILIFIVANGGESRSIARLDRKTDAFNSTSSIPLNTRVNSTDTGHSEETVFHQTSFSFSSSSSSLLKSSSSPLSSSSSSSLSSSSSSSSSLMLQHVRRRAKREMEPDMPFDFQTKHLSCDLDQKGISQYIDGYPNHCIWVWNNRYVHEGFYRVYKTYQLEAFTFGQFFDRMNRYELETHSWDYSSVHI